MDKPDNINSTKQTAVIQWLMRVTVVLRINVPCGRVMAISSLT
jgi:hypothetical protein